jgi:hypothetical protein
MKNTWIIIFFGLMLFSCNNKKKQEKTLKDAKEKVTELTGRDDLCSLLDEQTVKEVFGVPDNIDFEKKDNERICSYSWTVEKDKSSFYQVSLNFANKQAADKEILQEMWDQQNEAVYNKKERKMEPVTNLGNTASWSNLGGGQLRVNAAGYIFFISVGAQRLEPNGGGLKSGMDKQEKIRKATVLARKIIKKL